ncbi:hypothetical protein LZC95_38630 [Pendulispora brunnea]|uniref:Uncharacterized protein n=1 Tax=Pendulispora brunnea TaxID=2905690 RepID=A0ABZ2K5E9_9BACT
MPTFQPANRTRYLASAFFVASLLGSLAGMSQRANAADDPRAARCVAAYEQAQRERREGKLTAAQELLRTCTQECPARFSRDCQRWQSEVEAAIPTVRFRVADDRGRKVEYARILVDGILLRNEIPEGPVAVDPGEHEFRFERIGSPPATVKVTLKPGERDREIAASIAPSSEGEPGLSSSSGESPRTESGSRPLAYTFGIVGIAALATSGVLLVKGHMDRSDLVSQNCEPRCNPDDVDSIRTLWWLSAASAGIGVVSLGLAYWQWPRVHTSPKTTVSLVPLPGGLAIRGEM